ncbi:hypothetical protein ABU614_07035 [Lysobacter firmicutimachus]|uniref:Beta protein n=1 Tax=Lysobacter firmicutimachus TaxID=1792846 RepID=A0AAU8N0C8_9GAMM
MPSQYANYPHYVPIVKWQKWERLALKKIDATDALRVLPCIEVRDSAQHQRALSDYDHTWSLPALVDYSNPLGQLPPGRATELAEFLKTVKGSATYASPVLNPAVAPLVFPSIKSVLGSRKVTLRVRLSNLDQSAGHLNSLKIALAAPGVAAATNRLIVDLGATPVGIGKVQATALAVELQQMKALGFEHLHLASGAFPDSLMHINGAGHVDRRDWAFWVQVAAASPSLLAGYSDYGPLTPNWSEGVLQRRGNRSVIRYALDDKWRIIRAATNTTSDSIAISTLMVTTYGHEFMGAPFSYGDQLIEERADPHLPLAKKRCGQYHITEFWNHHIAHVVKRQY